MELSRKTVTYLVGSKKDLKSKCSHNWQFCECSDQYQLELKMARSNIPFKFWQWEMEGIKPQNTLAEKSLEKLNKYIKRLGKSYKKGIGLFIFGPSGSGKTCSSCIILKHVLRAGYTARFTMLSECITMFADGWYDRGKREQFVKELLSVDFLVIDDIGKEFRQKTGSDINRAAFDSIFRQRANEMLPTIITSNHDEVSSDNIIEGGSLSEMYGGNLISLFSEHLIKIHMIGHDFRTHNIGPLLEKELFDES